MSIFFKTKRDTQRTINDWNKARTVGSEAKSVGWLSAVDTGKSHSEHSSHRDCFQTHLDPQKTLLQSQ